MEGLRQPMWSCLPDLSQERNRRIEFMAQAFIEATGLDPTDAVLVEQRDGDTIKWWFEKRTGDV